MKIVKAICILLFGPLLGILVAFALGALAMRPDPNFVASGGHVAPGDGFEIMRYMFISLLVSVPGSLLLAGLVLFRRPKASKEIDS